MKIPKRRRSLIVDSPSRHVPSAPRARTETNGPAPSNVGGSHGVEPRHGDSMPLVSPTRETRPGSLGGGMPSSPSQ